MMPFTFKRLRILLLGILLFVFIVDGGAISNKIFVKEALGLCRHMGMDHGSETLSSLDISFTANELCRANAHMVTKRTFLDISESTDGTNQEKSPYPVGAGVGNNFRR